MLQHDAFPDPTEVTLLREVYDASAVARLDLGLLRALSGWPASEQPCRQRWWIEALRL